MYYRKLTFAAVLFVAAVVSVVFSFTLSADPPAPAADNSQSIVQRGGQSQGDSHHDLSPPLRTLPPAFRPPGVFVRDHERLPRPYHAATSDPVLQRLAATAAAPATTANFDGIGNGVAGFTVNSAPPDTNGDVGPNHYVQIVNTDFAVYSKSTGAIIYGPVPINTVWSGFGGGCQTNNDGDPTVVYDRIADRWVISQFSVSSTPYLQCVAVSQTNDPTGSYFRYSFSYGNSDFPDYPKMGVWPDAYYTSFNIFGSGGNTFSGARVCAYDRSKMLLGQTATQQCFNTSTTYGGILPSHLTGANLPPSGAPNYVVGLGATNTTLAFWKFQVDWTTPANSTFTGPTALTVASYTEACGSSGTCIPQSGTTQQLDSLSDRLMYRLAYRNFGDHESLVVNHSVTAGSSVGVRWYELRTPGTTPTVFQQGTYAPDSSYRWMGSIAMDQSGDIALGYSTSSSSLHPQINYTGRLSTSPAGVMDQGEGTIINGAGSQTGQSLSRWGDYSSLSVDPTDDCTFWYTNEYIPSNGAFNWRTRIGSFKFAQCGGSPTPTPTPTPTVTPTPTPTVTPTPTPTVTPTPTPTVTPTPTPTVTPTPTPSGIGNGGFETGTLNGWTSAGTTSVVTGGHSGTYAARAGSTNPTNGDSDIIQTFTAPAGSSQLTFWYKMTCPDTITYDWATATLKDNTTGTTTTILPKVCATNSTWVQDTTAITAGHSYTLTLVSHDDNYTGDATYTLFDDVATNAAPTPDFTISANPTTLGIPQGSSRTSTINTTQVGSAGTVNLTASVSPAGPTVSLSPTFVAAGGSSTLTVNAGSSVAVGNYTVTITATEGSSTHNTTVAVSVAATTGGIANGDFETGTLSSWISTGTTSVVTGGHSGTYCARAGSTSPTNGDSSISQTFIAPSGSTTVVFWYKMTCPDTITYDWATATLKDNTTSTTTTILRKVCATNSSWVQDTAAITAGHSYTLTLVSHDDNYVGDATYTLFDDVQTH